MTTNFIESCSSVKVLVAGDVMLDRYWYGNVERISPESPVPIVEVAKSSDCLGGAGNVAANVAALNSHCKLLSIIGEDEAGKRMLELLDKSNIQSKLHIDRAIRTTEKLRIVARNQQLLRVDFEDTPDHEILSALGSAYEGALENCDVVIMSDYGKGGLTHIASMIQEACARNIPVVVDPKGADFSRYRGASIITPNLKEFATAGGIIVSEKTMADSALRMIDEYSLGSLLITRSKDGMTLFLPDGKRIHSPATAREVFDVSGAGDTVVAIVALSIALQVEHDKMLDLCNQAAGYVVSKFGTAVIEPSFLFD